ncbi:MAG: RNA methyltransferase [Anaerolineaceae bacterium]|jgi:TrmH family RNA methyltransferase|nr:MAG: RNA methyltransferase [Anaerolineaceae bacterium]
MITSIQNPKIQWVRSLLARKKERYQDKAFVCEGIRLAEEVIHHKQAPLLALFSSSISERGKALLSGCTCEKLEVAPALLDRISDTETSQGLLLVVPFPELPLPAKSNFGLVLDEIQDAGNFGTILRAAVAFGLQSVFYTPGSVDPYSPKVVRSAMGAHFQMPLREANLQKIRELSESTQLFLAEAQNGIPCWEADLTQPITIVIGSEAFGATQAIRQIPHKNLLIPMPGSMESLNAAMSANILLYEVVRQRKL